MDTWERDKARVRAEFRRGLREAAIKFLYDRFEVSSTFMDEESNICVSVVEVGGGTTEQLNATPLLRSMFKSARMVVDLSYNAKTRNIDGSVRVSGLDIMGNVFGVPLTKFTWYRKSKTLLEI